mgnify:CR=1 FL=1
MKSKVLNILLGLFVGALIWGCTTAKGVPTRHDLMSNGYSWEDQEIEGMVYRVFYKGFSTSQTGYAIAVINVTKDKLEVQKLRESLK